MIKAEFKKRKTAAGKRHGFFYELLANKYLYLLALPGLLFFFIFSYLPMVGLYIAFLDFNPIAGMFGMGSKFVGLDNFKFFFTSNDWLMVTLNTLFLNALFITSGLAVQIFLAVGLNELGNRPFKRTAQTFMYLPNFLSWTVISVFSLAIFGTDGGMLNNLLTAFGLPNLNFYQNAGLWPGLLVALRIWKGAGFGTVIFLSTITGIDQEIYEAATIDGASRLQGIFHITLPMLKKTTVMLLIMKEDSDPQYSDSRFTSRMYWLKPVDPINGVWESHYIGQGSGDWPHGSAIGPVLPGGRVALILGYHSANNGMLHYPELFEAPDRPAAEAWSKRTIAEIQYGEEFALCDIDGDGLLDVVAGEYWLENKGDGSFAPHRITSGFKAARVAVMDVNGDGRPDVVMGEEAIDFQTKKTPFSRLAWFENPMDPANGPWEMHVIDTVRCGHSIGVGDLDGDGEPEIVCGEHDPFRPYRSRCHLLVYKKADKSGKTWKSTILDERFEHHDGAKVFEVAPGRPGIASHGWKDSIYVHLWEKK